MTHKSGSIQSIFRSGSKKPRSIVLAGLAIIAFGFWLKRFQKEPDNAKLQEAPCVTCQYESHQVHFSGKVPDAVRGVRDVLQRAPNVAQEVTGALAEGLNYNAESDVGVSKRVIPLTPGEWSEPIFIPAVDYTVHWSTSDRSIEVQAYSRDMNGSWVRNGPSEVFQYGEPHPNYYKDVALSFRHIEGGLVGFICKQYDPIERFFGEAGSISQL